MQPDGFHHGAGWRAGDDRQHAHSGHRSRIHSPENTHLPRLQRGRRRSYRVSQEIREQLLGLPIVHIIHKSKLSAKSRTDRRVEPALVLKCSILGVEERFLVHSNRVFGQLCSFVVSRRCPFRFQLMFAFAPSETRMKSHLFSEATVFQNKVFF